MDDRKLKEINHPHASNESISELIHELTQSLMVINTYINGCIYRLQENKIDYNQLLDIMGNIKQHSSMLGYSIHELKDLFGKYYGCGELVI